MTEVNLRPSPGVGSGPPPSIAPDSTHGYIAEASGLVMRVELAQGKFDGLTSSYSGVRGVLVSPDGKFLYIYSPYGLFGDAAQRGQIVPYDATSTTPTHGADTLGYGTYAVAASPDGRYVVAASSGYDAAGRPLSQGSVTIIDTRDFSFSPVTVPGGRGTIAFSADGRFLFVADAAGLVTKVDIAHHTALITVRAGGGWLYRSADPEVMYVTDGRTGGAAIDVRTGQVLRPVSLSG